MIEIKDLLARFSEILLGEEGKKESVRNAISGAINIEIKSEDIRIKNNVELKIKGSKYNNEL